MQPMPKKLTAANSVACKKCEREVHKSCAGAYAMGYLCEHCSVPEDEDDIDDESDE